MSRPWSTSERRVLLLIGDAFTVTLAVVLALWTWSLTSGFPFGPAFLRERAAWFLAIPLWLIVLAPTRDARVALDLRLSALGVLRATGALLLVYLVVFFYTGGERLPRLVALYLLWDASLLVAGWRLAAQWFFTRAPFTRRILIAGSGRAVSAAFALLTDATFRDSELIGVATLDAPQSDWHAPVIGVPHDVDTLARRLAVTDIVVSTDGAVDDEWVQCLLRCQEAGINVIRMAQLYEDTLDRVPIDHVEPSWLLTNFFDVTRSRDRSPLAKRMLDLTVGTLLMGVALIMAPVVILAILAESRGPVLYRQERLGRGGRPFKITKFRTMKINAEADGKARWSAPGDPRVTRVGRVLRLTRLDELPNVVSVLRGEMSMVGPRPERPEFVETLEREIPFYRARLIRAPGLTGWAQVNWPYGDSVADAKVKLEYDLYYIKHQSLWFDLLIMLRTMGTMLRFQGR